MSKQTSVEWLENQLKERYSLMNSEPLFEQAKAMEREQRFQDFKEGFQAAFDSLQAANNLVQNKKYGGNKP
jgi:hypothetical protein